MGQLGDGAAHKVKAIGSAPPGLVVTAMPNSFASGAADGGGRRTMPTPQLRVVVEGDPRVELNTHVSHPVLDSTDAGSISTAARVVNAIEWICNAPTGLLAVEDIPQAKIIRGLMW